MRIIAHVSANSGPSYHRLIMPLMYMEDADVFVTNNLLEEHFEKGCDVFMYNRVLPVHAIPTILRLQKQYGFKIVIDIDDHWQLDPHHVLYAEYMNANFSQQQIDNIRMADAVLVTHERLADEVGEYCQNVHIIPNAIPRRGQFDIEHKPSHLVRLFWQGSVTHREDIALLREPINKLSNIAGKIKMLIVGWGENEPEWDSMVSDYTAAFKHQYLIIPGKHVAEYYEPYAQADICLIPLLNSPFNRHKSNLKVLEAANMGLPCIVSDVHPYKDLPVLYAKSGSDWVRQINRLVSSSKRRKEAGQILADYCDKHFNFDDINRMRRKVLLSVAAVSNVK